MHAVGLGAPTIPTIIDYNEEDNRSCCGCFPWRRRRVVVTPRDNTIEKIAEMSRKEKEALAELAKTWGDR